MKAMLAAIAISTAAIAPDASAQVQGVDLNGTYRCVVQCDVPGGLVVVTQYGTQLNVRTDAGRPSVAWVDYPGHIWLDWLGQGAKYSPDGMRIQLDRGTVWHRVPARPAPFALEE